MTPETKLHYLLRAWVFRSVDPRIKIRPIFKYRGSATPPLNHCRGHDRFAASVTSAPLHLNSQIPQLISHYQYL